MDCGSDRSRTEPRPDSGAGRRELLHILTATYSGCGPGWASMLASGEREVENVCQGKTLEAGFVVLRRNCLDGAHPPRAARGRSGCDAASRLFGRRLLRCSGPNFSGDDAQPTAGQRPRERDSQSQSTCPGAYASGRQTLFVYFSQVGMDCRCREPNRMSPDAKGRCSSSRLSRKCHRPTLEDHDRSNFLSAEDITDEAQLTSLATFNIRLGSTTRSCRLNRHTSVQ